MRLYAMMLLAFYFVTKLYVRSLIFRPTEERPAVTRHGEVLGLIDLTAWLALVGGFFLLLNLGRVAVGFGINVVAVLYDLALRNFFLRWEIGRIRRRSPKLSRVEAKGRALHRARMMIVR